MPRVGVVLAAGGMGRRLGGSVPKQFLLLDGVPIIVRTLRVFASLLAVGEIVIVVPRRHVRRAERMLARVRTGKVISVAGGGSSRQQSVWNGLAAFSRKPDIVLVHDAVRPFVRVREIRKVIAETIRYGAAFVGFRLTDTVKLEGRKGFFAQTLPREHLWGVQTPQGFRFDLLERAHLAAKKAGVVGTDDASLVERLGVSARIVEGDGRTIKITTKNDLIVAHCLLSGRSV